ncbi:GNAT family N-acetyltransferase [Mammaliicoccus sp. Dog046]|uniref:GNAT family N-acetyltransferase n=1 Tax=Mammaliicoccus sp. Dog046 TaxID=3034233 RepID=UPI002B2624B1|nr:GNAT family N-acetyltransferase [Mammaliicoccus sp. Dog046]WQK85984.1 GNAT family N-acetyltransferase [Mammaliicoccus sp. Dog046]
MNILPLNHIDEISTYILDKNAENKNYVEFIPRTLDEIKLKLTNTFDEQSFYYMEDNQEIVGILGFEKIDTHEVNVWGPIVNDTSDETLNALEEMWKLLLSNHPDVQFCHIALHKDHQLNNSKLKRLHAGYVKTHYTLEIQQPPLAIDEHHQMTPYSKPYYYAFHKLHANSFKDSDISADDIIHTLGDNHALYLYIAEGLVKGYIYSSIQTSEQLATIPYLASHHDYRKQGIAFQMIHYATTEAFKHEDVQTVRIHVDSKKHEQIQLLYEKIGFKIVDETHHFKYVHTY